MREKKHSIGQQKFRKIPFKLIENKLFTIFCFFANIDFMKGQKNFKISNKLYNFMSYYNETSFYRAHPYQHNLPPGALKNRKESEYHGEIPQGRQYFDPTAKKHYQINYPQTSDVVKSPSHQYSMKQSEVLQRSYFRSLNAGDIEGASTNTLISKAVKNRLKAQEALAKRHQIPRQDNHYTKEQLMEQYHHQDMKKQQLTNYHNQQRHERQARESEQIKQRTRKMKQIASENRLYQPPIGEVIEQPKAVESVGEKYAKMNSLHENYELKKQPPVHNRQSSYEINPNQPMYQKQKRPSEWTFPKNNRNKEPPPFGSRKQHRQYNPTFLSYGVNSNQNTFNTAGKNLLGY